MSVGSFELQCAADDVGEIAAKISELAMLLNCFDDENSDEICGRLAKLWPESTSVSGALVRKLRELERSLRTQETENDL